MQICVKNSLVKVMSRTIISTDCEAPHSTMIMQFHFKLSYLHTFSLGQSFWDFFLCREQRHSEVQSDSEGKRWEEAKRGEAHFNDQMFHKTPTKEAIKLATPRQVL